MKKCSFFFFLNLLLIHHCHIDDMGISHYFISLRSSYALLVLLNFIEGSKKKGKEVYGGINHKVTFYFVEFDGERLWATNF